MKNIEEYIPSSTTKTKSRIISLTFALAMISTLFIGGVAAESLGDRVCSDTEDGSLDRVEGIIQSGLSFLLYGAALVAAALAIASKISDVGNLNFLGLSISNWYDPISAFIAALIIIVVVDIGFDLVLGIDISCIVPDLPGGG